MFVMIRVMIVDDEFPAIQLLESYIERIPFLELVISFRNPLQAIAYLQSNSVDLIFLDINMRELSGITFLKTVQNRPHVILTTAYSEYAVESYEYDVMDYLLKPITFERFLKSVTKLQKSTEPSATQTQHKEAKRNKVIFIKDGYENVKLSVNEILYLKKEGNYITYFTEHKKVMSRQTVQQALENLDDNFLQIHKSFIANCSRIDSFRSNSISIGNNTLPVGQLFKTELNRRLKK